MASGSGGDKVLREERCSGLGLTGGGFFIVEERGAGPGAVEEREEGPGAVEERPGGRAIIRSVLECPFNCVLVTPLGKFGVGLECVEPEVLVLRMCISKSLLLDGLLLR